MHASLGAPPAPSPSNLPGPVIHYPPITRATESVLVEAALITPPSVLLPTSSSFSSHPVLDDSIERLRRDAGSGVAFPSFNQPLSHLPSDGGGSVYQNVCAPLPSPAAPTAVLDEPATHELAITGIQDTVYKTPFHPLPTPAGPPTVLEEAAELVPKHQLALTGNQVTVEGWNQEGKLPQPQQASDIRGQKRKTLLSTTTTPIISKTKQAPRLEDPPHDIHLQTLPYKEAALPGPEPGEKPCPSPADHVIFREGQYQKEIDGRYSHINGVPCLECCITVVGPNDPQGERVHALHDLCNIPSKENPVWVCSSCQKMLLCNSCFLVKKTEYDRTNPGKTRRNRRPPASKAL
jgi:hypothetical protein